MKRPLSCFLRFGNSGVDGSKHFGSSFCLLLVFLSRRFVRLTSTIICKPIIFRFKLTPIFIYRLIYFLTYKSTYSSTSSSPTSVPLLDKIACTWGSSNWPRKCLSNFCNKTGVPSSLRLRWPIG